MEQVVGEKASAMFGLDPEQPKRWRRFVALESNETDEFSTVSFLGDQISRGVKLG